MLRSPAAVQLLSELLEAGATEAATQNHVFIQDDDHEQSFAELRASGLATWADETSGRIAATRKAASCAGIAQLYHGPSEVCEYVASCQEGQDTETSDSTSTVFDLLIRLLRDGWKERGLATKGGRRPPPPYTQGGERILVYHTGSQNIGRLYLECLCSADELFEKGIKEIHHFQTEMYYRTLMECEPHQSASVRPHQKVAVYRELLGMKPRAGRGSEINLLFDGNSEHAHQPAMADSADGDVNGETTDADDGPAVPTYRDDEADEAEDHESVDRSNAALCVPAGVLDAEVAGTAERDDEADEAEDHESVSHSNAALCVPAGVLDAEVAGTAERDDEADEAEDHESVSHSNAALCVPAGVLDAEVAGTAERIEREPEDSDVEEKTPSTPASLRLEMQQAILQLGSSNSDIGASGASSSSGSEESDNRDESNQSESQDSDPEERPRRRRRARPVQAELAIPREPGPPSSVYDPSTIFVGAFAIVKRHISGVPSYFVQCPLHAHG
ncbi:chk1, partial [Symbiodinium sp. CCMP2592]